MGITGAGPEHAFVLAEPLDDETRGPQPTIDGDQVFAVEWHTISDHSPIGGLAKEFWSPLGELLRGPAHGSAGKHSTFSRGALTDFAPGASQRAQASSVLGADERRRERQVEPLALGVKREEVAGDLAWTGRARALARPTLNAEGVEAVVDRGGARPCGLVRPEHPSHHGAMTDGLLERFGLRLQLAPQPGEIGWLTPAERCEGALRRHGCLAITASSAA